jgi:hypothetical protein
MFHNPMSSRCLTLALTAAAIALPRAGSAQQVVTTTSGSGVVAIHSGITISDEAARALVERNLPNVLLAGAEENQVILVVDANGQYVTGKAAKATVIRRTSSDDGQPQVISLRDSTGAGASVMVRRMDGATQVSSAGGGVAVFTTQSGVAMGGMGSAMGVMGMGISPADIDTMGTKNIPAGQWRDEALIVTVIKLK